MAEIAPRILFWETSDERVLGVARLDNLGFTPFCFADRPESHDVRSRVSPEEIATEWDRLKPRPVPAPKTDPELAAAAVALGLVDGAVGGAVTTSAAVLGAGLRYIGTLNTVSMALLATPPAGLHIGRQIMLADCGVVLRPTSTQLADIALASAQTWERVTGERARVAFIGATTKSGGDTPEVQQVNEAISMVFDRNPDILIDGELQVDAALSRDVASRKGAPVLGGTANILVFPDLISANASCKLLEHLGGYSITFLTQGFRRPLFDVSRGCTGTQLLASATQCAVLSQNVDEQ